MAVVVSLAISGCAFEKHNWTYSLSRQVYDKKHWTASTMPSLPAGMDPRVAIIVLGAIFVLPVVIDTVILPVTVTHDYLVAK